jgi:hypothetical protein
MPSDPRFRCNRSYRYSRDAGIKTATRNEIFAQDFTSLGAKLAQLVKSGSLVD